MSREILFRGKCTDADEWVYGFYTKKRIGWFDGNKYKDVDDDFIITAFSSGGIAHVKVIPETIGQFTGLTDKNGVKIFEGDKVKGKYYGGKIGVFKRIIGVVTYRYERFGVKGINQYTNMFEDLDYSFEVIGNIHEVSND